MKNLLYICLLVISQKLWAACDYKTSVLFAGKHIVSPVKSLMQTVTEGRCNVKFSVVVDSYKEMFSVEETETDIRLKGADLCRVAIRNGIEKMLLKLGEKIDPGTDILCREDKRINAGDLILEGDVGLSKVHLYFKYQGMRCRNFLEKYYDDGKAKQYFGVICQPNSNEPQWLVMDKW